MRFYLPALLTFCSYCVIITVIVKENQMLGVLERVTQRSQRGCTILQKVVMKTIKHHRWAVGMMIATLIVWHVLCFSVYAVTASHKEFKPGEIWTDTSGVPINAHGGGILYHDKVYYWYGEIKTGKTWLPESNRSWSGTRVESVGIS